MDTTKVRKVRKAYPLERKHYASVYYHFLDEYNRVCRGAENRHRSRKLRYERLHLRLEAEISQTSKKERGDLQHPLSARYITQCNMRVSSQVE